MKRLFSYIGRTIKKFALIVGIPRTIIAFVIAVAVLYSPGVVGVIIGKPEWLALNAAFWFAPGGTPGIACGVFIGILALIVISPKEKKQQLREELKITGGEIKKEFNELAEKFRKWIRGDDL